MSARLAPLAILADRGTCAHWRPRPRQAKRPDPWSGEPGSDLKLARELCQACPVRRECLAYAIRQGETVGVWGGLTQRERAALIRSEHARSMLAAAELRRAQDVAVMTLIGRDAPPAEVARITGMTIGDVYRTLNRLRSAGLLPRRR